ncbi:hypothetical protein T4A_3343 [Trichinella pseudospiralis]|uniref:Uncharacterized protein n=1 Tax=Trichinella pseudospiralis TaxID=6337 RepID=A0A0V1DMH2_TRIPS|nr:hypothetical protein T4A_3343 [Trichinella pseudospiralis]
MSNTFNFLAFVINFDPRLIDYLLRNKGKTPRSVERELLTVNFPMY